MKFDPTGTLQAHAFAVLQDPASSPEDRSAATQALLKVDDGPPDWSHLTDAEVEALDDLLRKALHRPALAPPTTGTVSEPADSAEMRRQAAWNAAHAAGAAVRAAEDAARAAGQDFDLAQTLAVEQLLAHVAKRDPDALMGAAERLWNEREAARVEAQEEPELTEEQQAAARRTDRKMRLARQLAKSFQR